MVLLTQEHSNPKLELLTRLVSERQSFLNGASTESGSTKRFMKKLARRRAIESQKLVSNLMSDGVSNSHIELAINRGITDARS